MGSKEEVMPRDYSVFFGSHDVLKQILDAVSETCRELGVDATFAETMADYHIRAMKDPELASKPFTSAYEVIDPKRQD
jgi:hypothetical protein